MKKWFVCLMVAALAVELAVLVTVLWTLAGQAAQDKPYTFSDSGVGTLVITSTTVDAVWPKAVRLFMTQDRKWVWAQGKGRVAWTPTLSLSFEQDGPDVRISAVPSVVDPKHPSRYKRAQRTAAASFFDALLEAMK